MDIIDRLLDRIEQRTKENLKLQRKLGRMAYHRNQAQARLKEKGVEVLPDAERTRLEERIDGREIEGLEWGPAKAAERDALRREKGEVEDEDELKQVRDALSLGNDRVKELEREARLHRDYACKVRRQSRSIHEMACRAVSLPEEWHWSEPATPGDGA